VDPLLEVGAMLPRANTIALRMAEREVGRSHGHRVCPGGTARTANRGSRNKGLSAQCSSFKNLIGGDAILVDERLVQEALDEAFIPRASVGGVGPATQG